MASPVPKFLRRIELMRKLSLDTLTAKEMLEVDAWFEHVRNTYTNVGEVCDKYGLGRTRNSFKDDAIAFTRSMIHIYKNPTKFTASEPNI
jgi:hypothetical protein